MTFEETARDAVRDGLLEIVLEDWCPPFPCPERRKKKARQ